MCGLAGRPALHGNRADPGAVTRMAEVMGDRGPDGEGSWVEGWVALAHRRLTVIDHAAGQHVDGLGLDARVPFLDQDLVALAAACPPELKVAQGGKGGQGAGAAAAAVRRRPARPSQRRTHEDQRQQPVGAGGAGDVAAAPRGRLMSRCLPNAAVEAERVPLTPISGSRCRREP